eukprot:6216119-Prymnesium_polylepis.1
MGRPPAALVTQSPESQRTSPAPHRTQPTQLRNTTEWPWLLGGWKQCTTPMWRRQPVLQMGWMCCMDGLLHTPAT